jgi:hypothetical protein
LGDRATGESGAGATGDDWQTSLASQEHDVRYLLGRRREGNGAWRGCLYGAIDATIVLIDEELGRV